MSDTPQTADAREAEDMGEKPDLGRTPDALTEALSGSDMGSDTRAGSLQGGAATGSEIDPDQGTVNEALALEGRASSNGAVPTGPDGEPVDAGRGEADAATG
jgi:hypothetical protein